MKLPIKKETQELIKEEIDKTTGNCMDENVLDTLVNSIVQIVREEDL